jgi:leader peptidase (prepilin peptidase)/N-methyltransferase
LDILVELQQTGLVYLATIGLVGLMVGSFLNVVIYRLPIMLQREWKHDCLIYLEQEDTAPTSGAFNLSVPRSRCPQCGHAIGALENIPVISYLLLQGRCKECKTTITIRYPTVELTTALISIVVAQHFGFSLQTAFALILSWSLICLTLIDYDTQLLPDSICLPLLWIGLFTSLFEIFNQPQTAIIGALVGYLSLWSVYWLFKLSTGKEGMGYGDFKLLAAIGAWLGWHMIPLVLMLSAIVGAIVGTAYLTFSKNDKNTPIPFGPYLAIAGFVALLWGDEINSAYLNFAGL